MTKLFPIQGEQWRDENDEMIWGVSWWITWELAEQVYKIYGANHSQSLERLAERAGFGAGELWEMITHGTYGEIGWGPKNYPSPKELAEFMDNLPQAQRKA